MHFGEAIGLLVLLTFAAVVLRFFWSSIPRKMERALLFAAAAAVTVRFIFLITLWNTTSTVFNDLLCWFAVVGYELMLVRFSLMRPRWLTSISALILLMPMFGSTLLFPLTGIFYTEPADITVVSKNYFFEKDPWDARINETAGYDYLIFYRPSFAPFMRHAAQRSSFSEEQCRSKSVEVRVDPTNRLVHFHCPGHQGPQSDVNLTLPIK